MKKNKLNNLLNGGICICLNLLLFSCRSNSDGVTSAEPGQASVSINIASIGNESSGNQELASITKNNTLFYNDENNSVIRKEIPGDNLFELVTSLEPVKTSNDNKKLQALASSSFSGPIAALNPAPSQTENLIANAYYKVVVYDTSSGLYVTEKNFQNGTSGRINDQNGLADGKQYYFVVYSVNTTTLGDLPTIDPTQNYSQATTSAPGNMDFMYFSTSITLHSGDNPLNVQFVRKTKRITINLDVSGTGYKIGDLKNVSLSTQYYPSMNITLSNGGITPTGTPTNSPSFVFNNLVKGSDNTTYSNDLIFNTDQISPISVIIGNIDLFTGNGPVQIQNLRYKITNRLKNGHYNLNIRMVPKDNYAYYKGHKAVILNGMIWMRYNLGADEAKADNVYSDAIQGNFYQWGRSKIVVANGSYPANVSNWDTTSSIASNSWYTTDSKGYPTHATNDPCPNGWRVSAQEINTLRGRLTSNTSRIWTIQSQYNSQVQLSIPNRGYYDQSGNLQSEALGLWTSVAVAGPTTTQGWDYYKGGTANGNTFPADIATGANVRCIADGIIDYSQLSSIGVK
ncbi:MAG: hypothetical protein LBE39_12055 [Flavobacteriaceae bacterium]|jgi:hypothetical protein|nr:hypothetical protein [Flavobacteriaceae bacterium]